MRLNTTRSRVARTLATVAVATLALSACSGGDDTASGDSAPAGNGEDSQASAEEYPGQFTVANGDSSFYVGELFRHDTVSAMCSSTTDGIITATISESRTGNSFTTTMPDEGAGFAGGTLTLGDGTEYTWVPLDGVTDEMYRNGEQIFEDENQSGQPVTWNADGTLAFGSGLRQATTESDEGEVRVQVPGQVDCSGGAAIPE